MRLIGIGWTQFGSTCHSTSRIDIWTIPIHGCTITDLQTVTNMDKILDFGLETTHHTYSYRPIGVSPSRLR